MIGALGKKGRFEHCSFPAMEQRAQLQNPAVCIIDIGCNIIECSVTVEREKELLASNDDYFAAYLKGISKPLENKVLTVGTTSLGSWIPSKTIWIMSYAELSFDALVDSGAFAMVLPYAIGKRLGFDKGKAEKLLEAFGVASSIKGYLRQVDLEIDDQEYEGITTLWCDKGYDTNTLLLGRADIFKLFTIVMDESDDLVEFIPKDPTKKAEFMSMKSKKFKSFAVKIEL